MKIERLNENQIRCTLNKSDLASRQLKINELAYGSDKAKELFRDMMQQASYELGFEAEDTDENFHSNSSAVKKRYVYKILNREFPDAVMNRYSWHYKYPLDIEKMRIAAKAFIGEHDFIGFASSGFSVKTTVREIYSLDVDKNGDIITIDVIGNGFLYNMVRIIAGTLVFVGGGKINPNDMTDIINSKDRERAGITAPPQGLCLKEVYY